MIVPSADGRAHEVRWSASRKAKAVMRLLAGESFEQVAASTGVPASTLVRWHEQFVTAGTQGLIGVGR